jgi:hypothetical protein
MKDCGKVRGVRNDQMSQELQLTSFEGDREMKGLLEQKLLGVEA